MPVDTGAHANKDNEMVNSKLFEPSGHRMKAGIAAMRDASDKPKLTVIESPGTRGAPKSNNPKDSWIFHSLMCTCISKK